MRTKCGDGRQPPQRRRALLVRSRLALTLAILAGLSSAVSAGNLVDTLAQTYSYNPRLDAERARLRATDEEVARANSGYRPTIDFQADTGRQNVEIRPSNNNAGGTTSPRGYSFALVQPLFRGFQVYNAVNEAEASVRAGRELLRSTEQTVLLDAVTAYGNVVRDTAIVRLRENNVSVLTRELKATQDRFAVGEVTRTDVAQAQARRALGVSDLDFAKANLKSSRASYELVVGVPPSNLSEPRTSSKLVPPSQQEAIAISARENPQVVSALYTEQGQRYTIDRIRGELLPSAQLEATYTDRFNSSRTTDEVETASIVGRVNVPIYEGGEVYARVRQAKHNHIAALQDVEQARASVQSITVQAWAQLQGSKAQLESDKAQIDANRTALNGVREEEKVGQRTLLDVLNAQQELLNSEVQIEITKRNILINEYTLISAIGRLNVAEVGAVGAVYEPEIHYQEVRRKWIGLDITKDDSRGPPVDAWAPTIEREPIK